MKFPHRRQFLHLAAGAAALPAVSRIARAQAYPSRPVRIIVGFPPGGGLDIMARLMGQWLSERLGKPFVIENKPGAGATIATEVVVRAPADGHTMMVVTPTFAIAQYVYPNLAYDGPKDFVPIALLMTVPKLTTVAATVVLPEIPLRWSLSISAPASLVTRPPACRMTAEKVPVLWMVPRLVTVPADPATDTALR